MRLTVLSNTINLLQQGNSYDITALKKAVKSEVLPALMDNGCYGVA